MSSPKITPNPGSSASDWRERASLLFSESDGVANLIRREALRRKATAADNIADAMEYAAGPRA